MPKTYVNVPMTEEQARRVAATDAAWTGPKLIALCAATLGLALTVLFLAAWGYIGPDTEQPVQRIHYFETD